jgi:hypothetical protein
MSLLPFSGPPTPNATFAISGKSKQLVYNVRDYGATGNGITDDTTAIQSALTAAVSVGGGIVFIPEATYVVSNITIGSYVELMGAGRGTQLLAKSGSSGYMIALTTPSSSQQTYIHDLTLKPSTGTLGGIQLDNTGFGTAIDPIHIIENVVVLNAGGDAFHFDNSMRELQVRGCYTHYSTGYSYYVGAGCTDSRFISCTSGPSTANAFEIIGNNNNFVACKAFYAGFDGVTWNTTSVGFHLNATAFSTFTNCSAQQCALHGWDIAGCNQCTITTCEADTNSAGTTGGVGFNTSFTTHSALIGNTGGNNGILSPGNQAYGVQVTGTQTELLIYGNSVTGSSGEFGYVSGFGYMLISGAIADFTGIPIKINDVLTFGLAGATSGTTSIQPVSVASGTITVPSVTDTLAVLGTAQSFTATQTFKKVNVTTGSNANAGTGTLSGGTVTISTTAVTASSLIFLTDTASSLTNVGILSVTAKSAGTSFTVTSSVAIDSSAFNWLIIN